MAAQKAFMEGRGVDTVKLWGEDWTDYDPTALAADLKGVDLFVSSGNGNPGPLGGPGASADTESALLAQARAFTDAAHEAGLTIHTDFYGDGLHRWTYWRRELARALPVLFPDHYGAGA